MNRTHRRHRLTRFLVSRPIRAIALAVAALPLAQATGCFPDPLGALNFQLQFLLNGTLINAITTIVQNLFRL